MKIVRAVNFVKTCTVYQKKLRKLVEVAGGIFLLIKSLSRVPFKVLSTAHQTIQFGPCTALILRELAQISN
jgi:hypothetical protein